MDEQRIRTALEDAFTRTGAGTPPWPDPHADLEREIDPQEYSRCLQPGKYRILPARAEAWIQALTGLGLAALEPIEPTEAGSAWRKGLPHDTRPTRVHWLRPHRAGAVPLLISVRGFDGYDDNLLDLGAGQPAVLLTSVPVCGCDACDDGSEVLLNELDDAVWDVITGAFAHVDTPRGAVQGGRRGWRAEGTSGGMDVERLLADARTGRCAHHVVHGTCWW
ncbi:DUF6226 family protein [Kineococcus sp. G2]|uniref:DUF6226 family protein n=1 Tax=Kineococcus sp. G2 TaxID=3127484 RepID=UPI00301DCA08